MAGKHVTESKKRKKRSGKQGGPKSEVESTPSNLRQNGRVGWWPLLSALALWASAAPLQLGFLGWLAPMGLLPAIVESKPLGRRGYFLLWVVGCVFWLLSLQGIRLAYWPLYFGWLALSLYLAVYFPLFVLAARQMLRWGMPLLLAAPVSWVGGEVFRSYFVTGYAANFLAHTQVFYPSQIQIADQLGAYGVSFLMIVVCVAVYECVRGGSSRVASVSVAAVLLVLNTGYGWWRLEQADAIATQPALLRALLVQENTPTMFESTEDSLRKAWTRYLNTTQSQVAEKGPLDLVVWPESTFGAGRPWISSQVPDVLPTELTDNGIDYDFAIEWVAGLDAHFDEKVSLVQAAATKFDSQSTSPNSETPSAAAPYLLMGCDTWDIQSDAIHRYNSAVLVEPAGRVSGVYNKIHLVMIGEYIPFDPLFHWLEEMFGLLISAGAQPVCFEVQGVNIAPNICFESVMGRFVRWQVRTLSGEGKTPDVIVNISNDSWFRGSAILDHHLACSMFCAVENRRPFLVAANTGLSAEIDGAGRLVHVSKRMEAEGILAEPRRDSRPGLTQLAGYPLGWLCCLIAGFASVQAVLRRHPE